MAKVLDGKDNFLARMKDIDKDELMERANSILVLNQLDEVLVEVAKEKVATKLSCYVTKGLNNRL